MITGISQDLYHIQGDFQQDKVAELSESQKEVWKDFLFENKSTVDLGGKDRTSELTFLPSSTPWNIFSFNPCCCSSGDQDMNTAPSGAFMEEDILPAVENDALTTESAISDDGSYINEERMPEQLQDGELYSNHEVLADGNYRNGDLNGVYLEKPTIESELNSGSTTENIINYARELLNEDSPLTSEWLSEHLGVAKLISAFPEFATYLNENSDLAISFMKGLEEVKSTLEDFFNESAVEKAGEFLSDDSPISDEWLAENLNAAHFIATHPAFAAYLQENIEQAEKFISLSA